MITARSSAVLKSPSAINPNISIPQNKTHPAQAGWVNYIAGFQISNPEFHRHSCRKVYCRPRKHS